MQRRSAVYTAEMLRLLRDASEFCSLCGRGFIGGDLVTAGYCAPEQKSPAITGACCASALDTIAGRLIWQTPAFETPPESALLWRYMDFSKFVLLLEQRALWFSRADKLDDAFELATRIHGSRRRRVSSAEFLRQFARTLPKYRQIQIYESEFAYDALRAEPIKEYRRTRRADTFVNCWAESSSESEALWRLYAGVNNGVAVQTTVARLRQALKDHWAMEIGRVKYVDYSATDMTFDEVPFRKRASLSYEREVRAVMYRPALGRMTDATGLTSKVAIEELIERVVISPFAVPWFRAVVESTARRFNLTIEISASEITAIPEYQ
jgi:hypothetical protein